MTAERRVVVIGAGAAGLLAARRLDEAFDVVVLDKGRGVGGRLATRRVGDATFDHGAQFITTHSAEFAEVVADWARAGVVEPWFAGQVGPAGTTDPDGHVRYRGVASANAIAKHLAEGLDVRTATLVAALIPTGDGWTIRLDDGTDLDADALVLAAPVPQAQALLAAGGAIPSPADQDALDAIAYDPCLAAMVVLDGDPQLPEPGAIRPDGGPIEWLADNRRKGTSAVPAVTIHATPEFSRAHWDDPAEAIVADLLDAAGLSARRRPGDATAQVQRWRFARPTTVHPQRCLVASGLPPLVFAGDAFGGPKVEGAALSGMAAATAIATLLDPTA
jgi:predicted NAD/FAD-dependent oxidoreductase